LRSEIEISNGVSLDELMSSASSGGKHHFHFQVPKSSVAGRKVSLIEGLSSFTLRAQIPSGKQGNTLPR
jgi:hypothetical protein